MAFSDPTAPSSFSILFQSARGMALRGAVSRHPVNSSRDFWRFCTRKSYRETNRKRGKWILSAEKAFYYHSMKTSAVLNISKASRFCVFKCHGEEETDASAVFPVDLQEQQGKPQQLLSSGAFSLCFPSEVTFSFPAQPWLRERCR